MKRFILLFTMAVFSSIVLSSCCKCMKDAKPEPRTELVTINVIQDEGHKPIITVDKEYVILSAIRGDQVMWVIKPHDKKFIIRFDKKNRSPFVRDTFNEVSFISGKSSLSPNDKPIIYRYSVEVDGEILDPGIIIWN